MREGIQRGCYESELCVISDEIKPQILLKNISYTEANGTKWG
jgi:hypothetical protein